MKPLHPYLAAALLALLVVPKLFQTDSHLKAAAKSLDKLEGTFVTIGQDLEKQAAFLDSLSDRYSRLAVQFDSTKADNALKIDAVGDALREHRNYLWEIRKNVGKIKAQFPDIE